VIVCIAEKNGSRVQLAFGVGPPVHVSRRSVVFAALRLSVFCTLVSFCMFFLYKFLFTIIFSIIFCFLYNFFL
jgi:hypothetical protein